MFLKHSLVETRFNQTICDMFGFKFIYIYFLSSFFSIIFSPVILSISKDITILLFILQKLYSDADFSQIIFSNSREKSCINLIKS